MVNRGSGVVRLAVHSTVSVCKDEIQVVKKNGDIRLVKNIILNVKINIIDYKDTNNTIDFTYKAGEVLFYQYTSRFFFPLKKNIVDNKF